MSFQRPPTIRGLKTRQMVKICAGGREDIDVDALARAVNFHNFLDRDVNDGFSVGEIKRCELLQLMAQYPDLMLFDEPESGVDLENMELIGRTIAKLLGQSITPRSEKSLIQQKRERTKMGLIITHTGHILDYVNATKGQVLFDGVMSCVENPREILRCIREVGYEECVRCIIGNNSEKKH
jgi:Fe-S cluster assembly ATP-binding protein